MSDVVKPYYKTENGKLYCGDCLEIMPGLEPVDLVLTSPPYNLGEFRKGSMFGKHKQGDHFVYSSYKDAIDKKKYKEWQRSFLRMCKNKLSKTGAIFYNHKPRIIKNIFYDQKDLIPFPIRQEIIWDKCCGFNYNGSFYVNTTERIYIIANDLWKPQKQYVKFGEVWRFSAEHNQGGHPAPFPKELASRVILSASKERDLVLDPFNGRGTTCEIAEKLNRRWIGIEISEKYCEIAAKRIENERKQLKLF